MHFLTSLYYDFQPPLCVDMKFVSIVKSDFMSNYFCRILFLFFSFFWDGNGIVSSENSYRISSAESVLQICFVLLICLVFFPHLHDMCVMESDSLDNHGAVLIIYHY